MKLNPNSRIEACVSTDKTRQVLHHPYLDKYMDKSVLVATDGRCIAVVPVQTEAYDEPGVVTVDAIKAARRAKPQCEIVATKSLIVTGGPAYPRPSVSYPNWRVVVPAPDLPVKYQVTLNVALLEKVCAAFGTTKVTLKFGDNQDPIRVHPASDEADREAFGIVMPMRTNEEPPQPQEQETSASSSQVSHSPAEQIPA